MGKILTAGRLAAALAVRRRGRKIVFTNGCFDILHPGHIRVLRRAKSAGDVLVVGLNTDASVRRLKGPSRPVTGQKSRAEVLAAISYVDYVVLFGEDTPLELIKKIRPDVLVKGADYSPSSVVGAEYSGKVVRIPVAQDYSTTRVIERIRKCPKKRPRRF